MKTEETQVLVITIILLAIIVAILYKFSLFKSPGYVISGLSIPAIYAAVALKFYAKSY